MPFLQVEITTALVVVVDTNEMLHHKRGGVVSDGKLMVIWR